MKPRSERENRASARGNLHSGVKTVKRSVSAMSVQRSGKRQTSNRERQRRSSVCVATRSKTRYAMNPRHEVRSAVCIWQTRAEEERRASGPLARRGGQQTQEELHGKNENR